MRWVRRVARMGKDVGAHRVLVEKSEGMKALERPRRRWGMILKWLLNRFGGRRLDLSGSE